MTRGAAAGFLRGAPNLDTLPGCARFSKSDKLLEHHGLNRCLDVGLAGYLRDAGLGVMSSNLHVIGRELLVRERRERSRGGILALAA